MSSRKISLIHGSGGGKKPRTPVEAPNTLQSSSTIQLVEVLSEGETVGLVGGLKGVFFDSTVVQNLDDSFNFPAVRLIERTGQIGQEPIPGFAAAENLVSVGTEIKFVSPVQRTVSSVGIDAVRILVLLPQGLQKADVKTGDQTGWRVPIAIDTRKVGGTWQLAFSTTITGKSISAYEESYRIERPLSAGPSDFWEIRIRRLTPESTVNTIVDRIDWSAMTEIQDLRLDYPLASVVGIAIDAQSTGGSVPVRSYLMDGLIIKVPVNYTPTQYNPDGTVASYAHYTGVWDGTFKNSWSDDPAWIVYDLLTNTRYGVGGDISPSDIDIYSFYEASKYSVELIDDGNGNQVPRFRCNVALLSREDAYKAINAILSNCRAYLWSGAGYIGIVQDRPELPSVRLTNSSVVDGTFEYSSSELASRITSVDVTFNDRLDAYQPRTITEQASRSNILKFGFRKIEIAAIGIVDEYQARYMAKWILESTLSETEHVNFRVSWNHGAELEMGQVIEIYDNFAIGAQIGGTIQAAVDNIGSIDIVLDRSLIDLSTSLPITDGVTISVIKLDGVEISGTLSNVVVTVDDGVGNAGTVSARFSITNGTGTAEEIVGLPFALEQGISGKRFKISSISHVSEGVYEIGADQYDPGKFARVEDGLVIPQPIFNVEQAGTIAAPTTVTATPETFVDLQGNVSYKLRLNWDTVQDQFIKGYKVRYRRDNLQYVWSPLITQTEYSIAPAELGIYEYSVFAINTRDVQSPPRDGFFILDVVPQDLSPSPPPTDLHLEPNGGQVFDAEQFTVAWTAPLRSTDVTLSKYIVSISVGSSGPVVHELQLPLSSTSVTITRDDIIRWAGSANRTIKVVVKALDTLQRLTSEATNRPGFTNIFVNTAPPVLRNIGFSPSSEFYTVTHDDYFAIHDAVGVKIHHSTSQGFTPSDLNLALDNVGATTHIVPADPSTTYYVRIGLYDKWSKAELNYSPEFQVVTGSAAVGITPDPVTGLAVSSTVATINGQEITTVNVSWNLVPGANQYDLEIINTTQGTVQIRTVADSLTNPVTYSFEGIAANQYSFRVRSRSAASVSVWSQTVTHTAAADNTIPTAPSSLTVVGTYQSITLSWTNPPDPDFSYTRVFRRLSSFFPPEEIASVPGPLSFYINNPVPIGASYQYQLIAVDRSGNNSLPSNWSNIVSSSNVPNSSITGSMIAANTILANNIQSNTITAQQIAANTITAQQIAANTITGGLITAGAINAVHLSAGAVTADSVAANTIITNQSNIADAVITNAKITGTISSSNYIPGSTGWAIEKSTGNAEFGSVLVRGELNGSALTSSAISPNSTRLLTSSQRLAPFVIQDYGMSTLINGGTTGSTRSITFSPFEGPDEGAANIYKPRRFVSNVMDVWLDVVAHGNGGTDTIVLEVSYNGSGSWTQITSLLASFSTRGSTSLLVRYTTLNSSWNTVAFRVRNTGTRIINMSFKLNVNNFNGQSANTPGSNSGTDSSTGGGGTLPPPEPWCVDENSFMLLPCNIRAKDVLSNDNIAVYNNDPNNPGSVEMAVQRNLIGKSECLRLVTVSNSSIIASVTTPMTLRDGGLCMFTEMLGKEALVYHQDTDQYVWETVTSLYPVGVRNVAKISVDNQCYFAGEYKNNYIMTHNIGLQKP